MILPARAHQDWAGRRLSMPPGSPTSTLAEGKEGKPFHGSRRRMRGRSCEHWGYEGTQTKQ